MMPVVLCHVTRPSRLKHSPRTLVPSLGLLLPGATTSILIFLVPLYSDAPGPNGVAGKVIT